MAGETKLNNPSKVPDLVDGMFHTTMSTEYDSTEYLSKYAWMPSTFRLTDDGASSHIVSYINGLGPRDRFPVLYDLIEKVFVVALPQLERSASFEYQYEQSASGEW